MWVFVFHSLLYLVQDDFDVIQYVFLKKIQFIVFIANKKKFLYLSYCFSSVLYIKRAVYDIPDLCLEKTIVFNTCTIPYLELI